MSTNDYTSKVPQYTFSSTKEKQERELLINPLVARMAHSRKTLSGDKYRPIYHFVNPESTLNDPNGLCYWKGNWHLFYQAYPPEDPRQHWGHAISENLINWKDLPYAIYPNPEEKCFSGATLVQKDRVIAMYHGTNAGNMIATSSDPLLLNWEKLTGQPVINLNPEGAPPELRVFDPCIWEKGEYYYSLSGGTLPHTPSGRRIRANFLFKSANLVDWKYLHPFIEGDHFTLVGDDGACPYFWPIGDRHILLFFSHMSGGQALLGDYDQNRDKFVVTSHHEFNFGPYGPSGVHAPSATPDGKGGVIVIFNMNAGMEHQGWNQIMTLPRRLSLNNQDPIGKDTLLVEPAGDIESLRTCHINISNRKIPANQEIVLKEIQGDSLELTAEIDTNNSPMVELIVFRSPNKEEFTRISFYRNRGFRNWERYEGWEPGKRLDASDSLISIDSSYSSLSSEALSRAAETAPVYLSPKENLNLRIFLDKSVLEVFVNGKQCVAMRVYPTREDSKGISIRSQGTSATLIALDAWQMRNIYD